MGNKSDWMDEAAAFIKKNVDGYAELAHARLPQVSKDAIRNAISSHYPAPSELERQVREKWEAIVDGDCTCEEFVQCEMCQSHALFGMFVQHNALRIAEALVARLPDE